MISSIFTQEILEELENLKSVLGFVVISICVLVTSVAYYYFHENKRQKEEQLAREIYQLLLDSVSRERNFSFEPKFLLSRADMDIKFEQIWGNGRCETLWPARIHRRKATVKIFNATKPSDAAALKGILREAIVLNHLEKDWKHPNLARFLGVKVDQIAKGRMYLAIREYQGSLYQHLKRWKEEEDLLQVSPSQMQMVKFCIDIGDGMNYLTSKQVVHGDLCTENVLLDEHLGCKIAGFECSQKLDDYDSTSFPASKTLRHRWAAVETLRSGELSCKTDVWNYGVTIWEIFNLAETPYADVEDVSPMTSNFLEDLENRGLRLGMPSNATREMYLWMSLCWNLDPDSRPTFFSLTRFFCLALQEFFQYDEFPKSENQLETKTAFKTSRNW